MATLDTSRIYTLTNAYTESGKILALGEPSSTLRMTEVISGSASSTSAQWFLTPTSLSPFYRLHTTSLGSGMSLDVLNDNGTSSVGLHMAATGDYSGQYWRFDSWSTGGGYRLSNNFTGPGMHLDVYSDTLEAHLAGDDHTGQHWTLNPAPAVVTVVAPGGELATPSSTTPTIASPASVSTTTSINVPAAASVTVSTTTSASGVTVEYAWR
ncbi:hypothetical protein GGR51DRAFT_500999 [Nemania sp. FL0031]|nr:hypothetical protein GGR51DRAFT_500999 [Nemania sp. FL0031]